MSKFKVILYFSFGHVIATENEEPGGDIKYFNTRFEADMYGQSKGLIYESVEVKDE